MCPEGPAAGPDQPGCTGAMDQFSLPLAGPASGVCAGCDGSTWPAGQPALLPYSAVGIDVGSVNVKVCGLAGGAARAAVVAHEGDIEAALDKAFAELALDSQAAPPAVVTGGAGRHRLDVAGVIALERDRSGARRPRPPAPRRRVPRRRGPRRLPARRPRARADDNRRQQVRVRHGRVLPPAARPHGPPPRGSRRGHRRRAGAEALGALLGVHEVRLHPPPEQGRGHQGRHRALALQGDGRQGRRVPDQGEGPQRRGGAHRRRHAEPAPPPVPRGGVAADAVRGARGGHVLRSLRRGAPGSGARPAALAASPAGPPVPAGRGHAVRAAALRRVARHLSCLAARSAAA